jgi:hypothetical protein
VQVDYDRFSGHTRTLYDQDWNPQDTELAFPKGEITEQPKTFEEMKKIAEKLGEDFDFMRVDLYTINDDIFFGELTPCPGAGRDRFRPTCYDLELGQFWK